MLITKMARAASILTLFAVLGAGLVAYSFQITKEQIQCNKRAALLRSLNALIPTDLYDNELFKDSRQIQNEAFLGTPEPVMIYRARKGQQPVASVILPIAPNGYNGRIQLLVGINYEGSLLGVRVLSHKETPGLGDNIELRRSNWILSFKGRTLTNPNTTGWAVKRDGGIFDQFTGATITPRAIVKAVHNTLIFYQQYRDEIFQ